MVFLYIVFKELFKTIRKFHYICIDVLHHRTIQWIFEPSIIHTIVHFKRLGSRHIHKEIELQKTVNGINSILWMTDLILIRRHTYKCNSFSDGDSGAFSKSAYVPLWYSQFQYSVVSKGGDFLFCNELDLIWFLSDLNSPHKLSLFFWTRNPLRPYIGHDNRQAGKQIHLFNQ